MIIVSANDGNGTELYYLSDELKDNPVFHHLIIALEKEGCDVSWEQPKKITLLNQKQTEALITQINKRRDRFIDED